MARRLIAADIFEDEFFGELDDRRALIWVGLITSIADDQGRFPSNTALIRSRLFPYRDVAVAEVEQALEDFVVAGKLHRYEADGRPLLQIVNWWKHQRPTWAQPSKHPPPEGWADKVRHRENGHYVEGDNWKEGPAGFSDGLSPSREPSHEPSHEASPSREYPDPDPDPEEHPSESKLSLSSEPDDSEMSFNDTVADINAHLSAIFTRTSAKRDREEVLEGEILDDSDAACTGES